MYTKLFFGAIFLNICGFSMFADDASVTSPDGRLQLTVSSSPRDSIASYRISYD